MPAAPMAAAAPSLPSAQAVTAPADDDAGMGDEPPSWVTEFSDDTAVAQDAPAAVAAPAVVRAPAVPREPYVITPVPALEWDGNWPALAASLPLRGVAQQLAFQTQLVQCISDGHVSTFRLRVPIDTLRASGNSEKLAAALQERFTNTKVVVDVEIGPVCYTASVEALALREHNQREAEQTVTSDPWVQDVMRQFDAFIVPGSVRANF
jgi:DNA polymerase-3 subunit gamma/tau